MAVFPSDITLTFQKRKTSSRTFVSRVRGEEVMTLSRSPEACILCMRILSVLIPLQPVLIAPHAVLAQPDNVWYQLITTRTIKVCESALLISCLFCGW
jgi:hypothetical protein